jgi:hypothetical protein
MTVKLAVLLIAAAATPAHAADRAEGLSARFTAGAGLQYLDEPWVRAMGVSVRIPSAAASAWSRSSQRSARFTDNGLSFPTSWWT